MRHVPRAEVAKQLVRFNVPDDCWDTIATSGDSARSAMFRGVIGEKVWFMGFDEDQTFFEPLKVLGRSGRRRTGRIGRGDRHRLSWPVRSDGGSRCEPASVFSMPSKRG